MTLTYFQILSGAIGFPIILMLVYTLGYIVGWNAEKTAAKNDDF